MTVTITRNKKSLFDLIPRVAYRSYLAHGFSGNTSDTVFTLPLGWKPFKVYVDGDLKREGELEDYTITFDGFRYSVVFAIAPPGVNIDVESVRLIK